MFLSVLVLNAEEAGRFLHKPVETFEKIGYNFGASGARVGAVVARAGGERVALLARCVRAVIRRVELGHLLVVLREGVSVWGRFCGRRLRGLSNQ